MMSRAITTYFTFLSNETRQSLDAVDVVFQSSSPKEGIIPVAMAIVKPIAWVAARPLFERYNIMPNGYVTLTNGISLTNELVPSSSMSIAYESVVVMLQGLDFRCIATDAILALGFWGMVLLVTPAVLHAQAATLSAASKGCKTIRVGVFGWWSALPGRVWAFLYHCHLRLRGTWAMMFAGMTALFDLCRRGWEWSFARAPDAFRCFLLALRHACTTIQENIVLSLNEIGEFDEFDLEEAAALGPFR